MALIADTPSSKIITSALFTVDGSQENTVMGGGSVMTLYLDGVETPSTLGQGGTYFTWNGLNSAGQPVASGPYYMKVEETDTYSHVNTLTKEVTVIKSGAYVELKVFNSAGELVRSVREYDREPPGGIALKIPDVIIIENEGSIINIQYGDGLLDFMEWDGRNAFGRAVSNGTYELQVNVMGDTGMLMTGAKTVQVLIEAKKYPGEIKVQPNPVRSAAGAVRITWQSGISGTVRVNFVNIKGESVRTVTGKLEDGYILWDLKNTSGSAVPEGIYICPVVMLDSEGYMEKKTVKVAVIK